MLHSRVYRFHHNWRTRMLTVPRAIALMTKLQRGQPYSNPICQHPHLHSITAFVPYINTSLEPSTRSSVAADARSAASASYQSILPHHRQASCRMSTGGTRSLSASQALQDCHLVSASPSTAPSRTEHTSCPSMRAGPQRTVEAPPCRHGRTAQAHQAAIAPVQMLSHRRNLQRYAR